MLAPHDFDYDALAVVDCPYQQTPNKRVSANDLTLSMDSTDSNASLSFDSSPVTPRSNPGLSRDHTLWNLSGCSTFADNASASRYKQDIPLLAPRGGRFVSSSIYSLQEGMPGLDSPTLPGAVLDQRFMGSFVSPHATHIWPDESYFSSSASSSFSKFPVPEQHINGLSLDMQHIVPQCIPAANDMHMTGTVPTWQGRAGVAMSMISPCDRDQAHMSTPGTEFKLENHSLDEAEPGRGPQHPLMMHALPVAKRHKIAHRQKRRQRRALVADGRLARASRGKFTCTEANCGKTFQRQEHYQRHAKSHEDASPFRCALTEFLGPQCCDRRCKRADNRDQHHHTHGKSGLCDTGPGGRNVLVEAEVLIQALKKTSFCDDQDCNRDGPCANPLHLELMDSKRQSRIDAQMARYVKNDLESASKKRKTRGIASVHVAHDQMRKLGFPECLKELQECRVRPERRSVGHQGRLPAGHQYFQYEQYWSPGEVSQPQDWRIDRNGCIFVRDVEDDGRVVERSLCGPLDCAERAASKRQGKAATTH